MVIISPPNLLRAITSILSLTCRNFSLKKAPTPRLLVSLTDTKTHAKNRLDSTNHHFTATMTLYTPISDAVAFERSSDCKRYLDKNAASFSLGSSVRMVN